MDAGVPYRDCLHSAPRSTPIFPRHFACEAHNSVRKCPVEQVGNIAGGYREPRVMPHLLGTNDEYMGRRVAVRGPCSNPSTHPNELSLIRDLSKHHRVPDEGIGKLFSIGFCPSSTKEPLRLFSGGLGFGPNSFAFSTVEVRTENIKLASRQTRVSLLSH